MTNTIREINLRDICITDPLFGAYQRAIQKEGLARQWQILNDEIPDSEPTHCIENFRVAAGRQKGTRQGVVFQDTDLYKWIETLAYCLETGFGMEYEKKADEVIDILADAQDEDGYLNTYFSVLAPERKWTNLVEGHELYTAGHLIEAAVAYTKATGKQKFLDIARKNADLICKTFGRGEGQIAGYPGHEEIELALVKLYHLTGEKKYLEEAKYFIEERGRQPSYLQAEMERNHGPQFFPEFKDYDLAYSQAHKPPIEQSEAVGHAVRDMYLCSAMADLAAEYEDDALENACKRIWQNMTTRRMYITGGIGSSGFRERFTTDYDLPNDSGYCETCASVGVMMFGQRMNKLTGEASYYDTVERALCNTVLAGMNIPGDRYFYVNPLKMIPRFCTDHTSMQHVKSMRQKWFGVACCPPNLARTLASLGQYVYAADAEGLRVNQLIGSSVETTIEGVRYTFELQSGLMQDGLVKCKATLDGAGKIRIRIPGYAPDYHLRVDGKEPEEKLRKGYLEIPLSQGTHEIDLQLSVQPRWLAANRLVAEDSGMQALVKGPFVYCLEEADNGDKLSEIYVGEDTTITEEEERQGLIGDLPTLAYDAVRIAPAGVPEDALYGEPVFSKEKVKARAIPYCLWNNRGEGEMQVWQKRLF